MADVGRKKPDHLRLVEGTRNVTRHGSEGALRDRVESAKSLGKPIMPKDFKGQAAWAWKRYIAPAWWMDRTREPAAIVFCKLWQEFQSAPTEFTASRYGQMRAFMLELGLTDERRRSGGTPPPQPKDDLFD